MRQLIRTLVLMTIFTMLPIQIVLAWDHGAPLVVDHTCTYLDQIPPAWIDSVQADMRLHYAHTSHGGQLTTGLTRIEVSDAAYDVAIGYRTLPTVAGAFCIFDGQEHDTYITPDEYWETHTGMDYTRSVLNNNPTINTSMWSWCTQLTGYTEAQTQAYLDSITALEAEYPDVIFVYMTCNAQATGSSGYNRYLRNQQIRQHCVANDRVLFDFADLDSWWYNTATEEWEHATYVYGEEDVPVEHPQFNGDEAGHTTYESCEQKGKAVWWMMARLAGWAPDSAGIGPIVDPQAGVILTATYPNPFTSSINLTYTLPNKGDAAIAVFDVAGRMVRELALETGPGEHAVVWDGCDRAGERLPAGLYFCRICVSGSAGGAAKVVLLD